MSAAANVITVVIILSQIKHFLRYLVNINDLGMWNIYETRTNGLGAITMIRHCTHSALESDIMRTISILMDFCINFLINYILRIEEGQ